MRLAIATAVALLAQPAQAEIIELKEGDVYCMAYDEGSNSCASVQTLKSVGEEEYLLLDLSGFDFGKTKLSMTSTMAARAVDGQICLIEGGVNVNITPKGKLATGFQTLTQYTLDTMAEEGYCFEHKPCGDDYVAIAYVGGKLRRDISATFRVFEADDERSRTVQPRFLGEDELSTMQKKVSEKCFPKDA